MESYINLLKKYKGLNQLNQVHGHMVVSGVYGDVYSYRLSKLIDSLFAIRAPHLASLVFKWNHTNHTVISYTSMIKGHAYQGSFTESIVFYVQMKRHHCFSPNNFSLPFALKSCGALKALAQAQQIHTDVVKLGFVSNLFVQTALLDAYVKCNRMESAKQVFDNMPEKSVVSWTAILAGYCRHGMLDQAQNIFHEMPVRNVVSWNAMIDGLARHGQPEKAQSYFDVMPQRNSVSWTVIMSGYSRVGNVEKARWLFDQMAGKEGIAWTAMITCYVQNGKAEEAIQLFHQMLDADVNIDEVTMLTIISAVSQLGKLHLCGWIEKAIIEQGFMSDTRILNAAINMYVQCGSIEKAWEIFHKMAKKDVISYNSMISGYATHGDAEKAFSIFSMMTRNNAPPNSITFTGLLSACAHQGLVEEGRNYFRLLLDLGFVELKSEHYACMVDLLGRAGYLDEAYNLIMEMPIKPSPSTWGALLGACKIHGNIGLAEVVAQRLFEIEPHNSGNYAILANMYADKRMWHSAADLRRVMKDKSLFKTPGSSWAELPNASVKYPFSA